VRISNVVAAFLPPKSSVPNKASTGDRNIATTTLVISLLVTLLSAGEPEVLADHGAGLRTPFSVVFDAAGKLYGVEYDGGNRVFSVDTDGKLAFIAGVFREGRLKAETPIGDGKPASEAHFDGMHELALLTNGDLLLADTFNKRVRKIDARTGVVSTLLGPDQGLASPHTVDLHANGKRLLVTDLSNRVVRELDLESGKLHVVAGNGKRGKPKDGKPTLKQPLVAPRAAIYGKDGEIWIASREGHALRRVKDGLITTVVNRSGKKGGAGDGGPGVDAQLNGPKHLALDGAGNVLISDDFNHCIRRYNLADGSIETVAGVNGKKGDTIGKGASDTLLNRPHGARIDAAGRLIVADSYNHRLVRFTLPTDQAR